MSFTYGFQGGPRLTVETEDGNVTFGVRNTLESGGYVISYIELPPEQVAQLIDYLEKERRESIWET